LFFPVTFRTVFFTLPYIALDVVIISLRATSFARIWTALWCKKSCV